MSTKVKGDKIKEGSIPMSALSNEIKDNLNKIFIMPEDFMEEEYNEPDEDGAYGKVKQVYVTDILENRYNKINVDGVLSDINITDDFIIITTKYEAFQTEEKQESYLEIIIHVQNCKFTQQFYLNKSPFVTPLDSTDAADINGNIRYNFVKFVTDSELTIPELTIPEKNKQLFKKNMGSFADWNAQRGEAGYIENKTHYYDNNVKFKYNGYDDLYETDYVPSDEGPLYIEDVYDFNRKYEIPSIETSDDGQSGYDWSNALTIKFWDASEEYYGVFSVGYNIDNNKVVAIYNANEADVDYDSRIKAMNIFSVVQIESEFIPNTVIKTTPQTLSDTDKNQALVNLGIDPVVWKYMCEPYIIEKGNYLPDYLLQLLLNDNPLILNLCKIKVVTEMYDEIAGANRPYVQLCNPIASRWGNETVPYLSLECITFYNNTYHTYHADIDIYENGEVCDIYEITE